MMYKKVQLSESIHPRREYKYKWSIIAPYHKVSIFEAMLEERVIPKIRGIYSGLSTSKFPRVPLAVGKEAGPGKVSVSLEYVFTFAKNPYTTHSQYIQRIEQIMRNRNWQVSLQEAVGAVSYWWVWALLALAGMGTTILALPSEEKFPEKLRREPRVYGRKPKLP